MEGILRAYVGDTTKVRIITTAGGAGFVGMVADVTEGVAEVVDGKDTQWFIAVEHVAVVEVAS